MTLTPPSTLTPSKISAMRNCPLAFRLANIDKIPERPSAPAVKGTLVHRILERLYSEHAPKDRSVILAAGAIAEEEIATLMSSDTWTELGLDKAAGEWLTSARQLVANLWQLEDPTRITTRDVELMVEIPGTDDLPIRRGIIDRLDVDPDGLTIVDYKTGKAPDPRWQAKALAGVHFYAALLAAQDIKISRVRLIYLRDRIVISDDVTPSSLNASAATNEAVWRSITRACDRGVFEPRPSKLCAWCSFQDYCPAQGGTLPNNSDNPPI